MFVCFESRAARPGCLQSHYTEEDNLSLHLPGAVITGLATSPLYPVLGAEPRASRTLGQQYLLSLTLHSLAPFLLYSFKILGGGWVEVFADGTL